jgi:multiple sugar transport system substrate-binding protein
MTTVSRRQVLKMLGLGTAGAVLAACAPKSAEPEVEPTSKPAATSAPMPTAPEATAPPPPTSEAGIPDIQVPTGDTLEGFEPRLANPSNPIKLVYWWGNSYEPAMEFTHQLIQRFSIAYPNVTVEPVGGQNCDAFVTAAAAGTPPDFFHTWDCVERMGNWAMRRMILPLDDYIAKDAFPLDDYVEGILDTCKMDGKIWGLVDTAGVFLLWTRPQQFADIGQSPDSLPADTDELWDWAKNLTTKDADGNIQRLGMNLPNWAWTHFTWISNFGGVLWDPNTNEPTPDHPGALEALNDLVAQVNYYGSEALDRWSTSIGSQGGEQNPWLAGNMTMQVEGDWTGQMIFDFHPDWQFGTDYGAAAPPPPPAAKQHGDSAVAFWSWPFVIPAGTQNPDWSWELLRFYLSPEYQVNVHAKFKEILVRKSMMDDQRLWWPAAKVARDIVKGGRKLTTVMPMSPVAGEYSNLLGEAFDAVVHLTETPEAAMARVKEEAKAMLDEVMS